MKLYPKKIKAAILVKQNSPLIVDEISIPQKLPFFTHQNDWNPRNKQNSRHWESALPPEFRIFIFSTSLCNGFTD